MKRMHLSLGILVFWIMASSVSFPENPRTFLYKPFEGSDVNLYPHKGRKIALLLHLSDLDSQTIESIIGTFDKAYDYYNEITGRKPVLDRNYEGLSTIAVVSKTCGAGCGNLGLSGIELTMDSFDQLYQGVKKQNRYDHVVFYELGRNFWFYGYKIEYKNEDNTSSITTGYAVFMRFMAMEAVGVKPGPFNGTNFSKFKTEVKKLADTYIDDSSLNWSNTMKVGKAPDNQLNLGATDLFASFLYKLKDIYGNRFLSKIWREVAKRPDAKTTQEAVDNFILAASATVNKNLTDLFVKKWRWPMSESAKIEATRFDPKNVALGKKVIVETNNANDNRESAGINPADITDGSLDYLPSSLAQEDGCVGYVNDDYNQPMVISITIDLNGTFNISQIRYNMGHVQFADTWNADLITTPFGSIKTKPGSENSGNWTEQTGNITKSSVTIKLKKTRTSFYTDWLFIGEIEIYGTPVD